MASWRPRIVLRMRQDHQIQVLGSPALLCCPAGIAAGHTFDTFDARPSTVPALVMSTVYSPRSVFSFFLPLSRSVASLTCAGSTCTTLCWPSSLQPCSVITGMVEGDVPPLRSPGCWTKLDVPAVVDHDRPGRGALQFRHLGRALVNVLADTFCASEAMNTCCRVIRSRSPRGRSWRCRTKLSAFGPVSVCAPRTESGAEKSSDTEWFQANIDTADRW